VADGALSKRIVAGKSIGGIKLGMTKTRAEKVLGRTLKCDYDETSIVPKGDFVCDIPGLAIRMSGPVDVATGTPLSDPRVHRLGATRRRFKTGKLVGVGSRFKTLKAAYPKMLCYSPDLGDGGDTVAVSRIRKVSAKGRFTLNGKRLRLTGCDVRGNRAQRRAGVQPLGFAFFTDDEFFTDDKPLSNRVAGVEMSRQRFPG
jgi:hypothetical protein